MLHLRTAHGARRLEAADLAASTERGDLGAGALVAVRAEGPFEPLGRLLDESGAARDALARALFVPSLRGYGRVRAVLAFMVLLPLGALLELDRELLLARQASSARAVIDLVLAAFVVFELTRKTPHARGTCAVALVAIALRWALVATRLCGRGVHAIVYAGAALAAVAAVLWLTRVPARSRIVLEIATKLGIGRSELLRATATAEPPGALVAAAVGCAAALPAILHLTRLLGDGVVLPAAAAAAFAVAAPPLARRLTDGDRPAPRAPARVLTGIVTGLALTAAVVTAGKLFFDVGAELARCVHRLDAETRVARAAESAELTGAIARVRASAPLVLVTTIVQPFAEERVYRGLLLDVLVRKYGRAYGLLAASLAFGLAHLGIYHVALYQTVLLGIGFGVAYLEGGLLAAFVVHATWNALQLVG